MVFFPDNKTQKPQPPSPKVQIEPHGPWFTFVETFFHYNLTPFVADTTYFMFKPRNEHVSNVRRGLAWSWSEGERKHTHIYRRMYTQGLTLARIWNTIKDLVVSPSCENNYTYHICCSVWFVLAAWKTAKAFGRKGQKFIVQRLSSHLPWPGFRQPQKAGKLRYFEPCDKDQLKSDRRCAKKNPILHKSFQRSATSVIEYRVHR